METFYAWKHDINDTGKNASSYTPVRAKSIEEAHIKAKKHFKYDYFHSRFKVSIVNHDGSRGISNTGLDIPSKEREKSYYAYHYFHDLPESMQQLVYDYCRNNNDDWRSKSKEELEAIVQELVQPFKNVQLANPYKED